MNLLKGKYLLAAWASVGLIFGHHEPTAHEKERGGGATEEMRVTETEENPSHQPTSSTPQNHPERERDRQREGGRERRGREWSKEPTPASRGVEQGANARQPPRPP